MFQQIALGAGLLLVTTVIHAFATKLTFVTTRKSHVHEWGLGKAWAGVLMVSAIVVMMFLATLVEAVLWAGVYIVSGAFSAIEPAVYFSIVTYTTLGYGDIVVGPEWRLLASIQASNGLIMFGWTTGLLVYAIQRQYERVHDRSSSG